MSEYAPLIISDLSRRKDEKNTWIWSTGICAVTERHTKSRRIDLRWGRESVKSCEPMDFWVRLVWLTRTELGYKSSWCIASESSCKSNRHNATTGYEICNLLGISKHCMSLFLYGLFNDSVSSYIKSVEWYNYQWNNDL
jgi:hypothetical protein